VNTVMNLQFHKMLGNSWVAERLAVCQEWLSSMELVLSHMLYPEFQIQELKLSEIWPKLLFFGFLTQSFRQPVSASRAHNSQH
jgi:hypothetical protein